MHFVTFVVRECSLAIDLGLFLGEGLPRRKESLVAIVMPQDQLGDQLRGQLS